MFRRATPQPVPVSRTALAADLMGWMAILPSCGVIGLPFATAAIILAGQARPRLQPADARGAQAVGSALVVGWLTWGLVLFLYGAIWLFLFATTGAHWQSLWVSILVVMWVVGVSVGLGYLIAFLTTALVERLERREIRAGAARS